MSSNEENALVLPFRTRAQMRAHLQRQQEIASHAVVHNTPPRRNLSNRNRVVTQISTPLPSHDGADPDRRGNNRSRILRQRTTARISTSRSPGFSAQMRTYQQRQQETPRHAVADNTSLRQSLRNRSRGPEPPQALHRSTVNMQTGDNSLLSAIGGDTTEEEGFICRICLEKCIEPKAVPCGHVFCGLCIHCWMDFNLNIRCPNCRAPISSESLLRLYV